jgi:two-component system, OmpR family, response regulator
MNNELSDNMAPGEDLSKKRIFTTGEAAALCKVSQQTIIRCFDSGRLSGFRVPGSKFRRIPREELLRFMRANSIPTSILEFGRKRVLVVDDDRAIVDMITEILARDNRLEVHSASNGYDAGLFTERLKPQLVILDYLLPDLNGNHVCQRIRGNEATRDTKILICSGVVRPEEVDGLLAAGAHDFIRKPFTLSDITGKIGQLLELDATNHQ